MSSIEYQTLRVSTPPAVEPVTLAEAKSHLRVDSTADDAYISTLVTAAREWVEQYLDRALIRQQLVMTLESFPVADDEIVLPRPPMATEGASTAVSVAYTLASGATATLSTSQYRVDRHRTPGEVQTLYGATWPADRMEDENSVTVTWWAGYGASGSSEPAAIRHAILMLVGHWYESRQAVIATGAVPQEVPYGVQSLLDSQRWGAYR